MKKYKANWLFCAVMLLCCSCVEHTHQLQKDLTHELPLEKVSLVENDIPLIQSIQNINQNTNFNDAVKRIENPNHRLAKRLAGTAESCSSLDSNVYQAFKQSIDKAWKSLNKRCLMKIPVWKKRYLKELPDHDQTVFYPFGGPDAAFVTQFFPNASRYILVGLELAGTLQNARYLMRDADALSSFQNSLDSFFKKGYFITSEMSTQLYSNYIKGVLPAILLQLIRLGYDITDIQIHQINQNGEKTDQKDGILQVLQIDFLSEAHRKQSLYYIRCALNNSNQQKLNALLAFVKQNSFVTFIKSSSYALHNKEFSQVREFVLNHTQALLQDDSGIPYRMIPSDWKVSLFGYYQQPPLKVFAVYSQELLKEAYRKKSVPLIPFKLGYSQSSTPSNLVLAIPALSRKIINEKDYLGGKEEEVASPLRRDDKAKSLSLS